MAVHAANDNERLVRRAFDAHARADIEAVREVLAPEAVWHVTGRGPLSGDYVGRDAIVGVYFVRLMTMSNGTFTVETHDVLASDEHVVALVTAQVHRPGVYHRAREVVVCHVRDGLVREVWVTAFDPAEDLWAA